MGIVGNGLRHCVRLGKIREIESEFSRIGVRMAQLRPNEVCRKFKAKNRFKNLKFRFQNRTSGARRESSLPSHVDRAVDRPFDWGVDLLVNLPVDTASRARRLGAPDLVFWLGLGWVLEIS